MRIPRIIQVAALVIALVSRSASAAPPSASAHRHPLRTSSWDLVRRLDVNDLNMFASNLGLFGADLGSGTAGLFYPRGTSKTALFAGGLWLGAEVAGQVRVVAAEYSPECGPGVILPIGMWDDPSNPDYVTYKVARWAGNPQDAAHVEQTVDPGDLSRPDPLVHHSWSEYMTGAVPHGAPWKLWRLPDPGHPGDSVSVPGPDVRGDRMLWAVCNDADPSLHTNEAGSSPSLGVEIRQIAYAYDRPGVLGNTIFLEFQIIHPFSFADTLKNAYVALWTDPDVGGALDDLAGCDSARALGYGYNGSNDDDVYGTAPPAIGTVLLRGPLPRGRSVPLGPAAFRAYVNGEDPQGATQSYEYMQGLARGGSPTIDPVTGGTTAFMYEGDPVAAIGWNDYAAGDKRMMLSAGPFDMAPGDTQIVIAALIVGQGGSRLSSLQALRYTADQIRQFFGNGVTPPDTIPTFTGGADACPRSAAYWADQCRGDGGKGLSAAQLDSIAAHVDALSRLFSWPGGAGPGFRGVVDPAATDLRAQAKQEFAALLANVVAGTFGITDTSGNAIYFNPLTSFSCPGLPERSVRDLLAPAPGPVLLGADYVNDNPAHRTALAGGPGGLPFFGGGAGLSYAFVTGLLPTERDSFSTVEIRFSHTATQNCYRYLRLEKADGSAPPQGRAYLYGGYRTCPFQVWDVTHNVQLEAAFAERTLTDAAGTILPGAQQPASFDSSWAPTIDSSTASAGGREYILVTHWPYAGSPRPDLAMDSAVYYSYSAWIYALWSYLRSPDDVIDDGDRFVFDWGLPPDTTFEAVMSNLETQPLTDPAVSARYGDIVSCLSGVNAGNIQGTLCQVTTPVLVSLLSAVADRDEVRLDWLSAVPGLSVTVERNAGDGWAARVTLTADGGGVIHYADRAVVPGTRYGYRLRVAGASAPVEEAWVEVPLELRLALRGLRPNPSSREVTVSFTLPVKAPATLELIDVAGRRLIAREVGDLGAGSHLLRLDENRRLPAGLYFMRLRQRGAVVTARGVIVR